MLASFPVDPKFSNPAMDSLWYAFLFCLFFLLLNFLFLIYIYQGGWERNTMASGYVGTLVKG